jgi:hypothetical protein
MGVLADRDKRSQKADIDKHVSRDLFRPDIGLIEAITQDDLIKHDRDHEDHQDAYDLSDNKLENVKKFGIALRHSYTVLSFTAMGNAETFPILKHLPLNNHSSYWITDQYSATFAAQSANSG